MTGDAIQCSLGNSLTPTDVSQPRIVIDISYKALIKHCFESTIGAV